MTRVSHWVTGKGESPLETPPPDSDQALTQPTHCGDVVRRECNKRRIKWLILLVVVQDFRLAAEREK